MHRLLLPVALLVAVLFAAAWLAGGEGRAQPAWSQPLPTRLSQTGLFDGDPDAVRADCLPFSPQYPLWSDGTEKRRWIRLPAGGVIDATDMDAWEVPIGTRLWKEFAFGTGRIETRLIERTGRDTWRFATYRWLPDGSEALLVGERGERGVATSPGGTRYDLPSVADCKACHEAARVPVLGFSALQLSGERDPLAPHGAPRRAGDLDLPDLLRRGLLRGVPSRWQTEAPVIVADRPEARAALGYLHGNCAHCHREGSPIPDVTFDLEQRVGTSSERVLSSLLARGHKRAPGEATPRHRLVPGDPDAGMLLLRLRTRDPSLQMPPLATRWTDDLALAHLTAWIAGLPIDPPPVRERP